MFVGQAEGVYKIATRSTFYLKLKLGIYVNVIISPDSRTLPDTSL